MRAQLSLRRLILDNQAAQKQVDENQRERGEAQRAAGSGQRR